MSLHNMYIEARKLATVSSIGASNCNGKSVVTLYPARKIITMNKNQPHADVVAVADGKIIAVGSKRKVKRALKKHKVVVNDCFADKVIVPGFIDQHLHPMLAAIAFSIEVISIEEWVLPDATIPPANDQREYRLRLKQAINKFKASEEVPIFFTWGYHGDFHGKLNRTVLDSFSLKKPVVVWHRSAHEFIMNSAAHTYLQITEEWILQQSTNAQSQMVFAEGHYFEEGYLTVLDQKALVYMTSPGNMMDGFSILKSYLPTKGVTTICEPGGVVSKDAQDMQNGFLGGDDVKFNTYYIIDGKTMANEYLDDKNEHKMITESERLMDWGKGRTAFLPKQCKLFADGAMFSQAMQMLPYKTFPHGYIDSPEHCGKWMMDGRIFNGAFQKYWDAGYQIHIHQNGSAGLELVLEQLEIAMRRNPREDHRTTLVHFGYSTTQQVKRLKKLGAIVSGNPYYTRILADLHCDVGIGKERANQMVRLGDVAKAGIHFSLHSDMSMAPSDPLFLMWCASSRITTKNRVAGSKQCVTVYQALAGVTIEAAHSLRLEEKIGSIEVGKDATFTILEQDPFESDKIGNEEGLRQLRDIDIWGTVLEGRVQPIEK